MPDDSSYEIHLDKSPDVVTATADTIYPKEPSAPRQPFMEGYMVELLEALDY
jgi:hypothetical protein